jgi:hypothetical protein
VRYSTFDEKAKILYLNDLPVPDSFGNLITRDVIYPEALSRSKCVKKWLRCSHLATGKRSAKL